MRNIKCYHINFSDNLLWILGFASAISSKQFYSKLAIRKSNSNETEEKIFLTHRLIRRWENDLQTVTGVMSLVVCDIPDKMFVYCDICEPYITGDIRTPLLRIVLIEIRSHNYAFGANLVKHFQIIFQCDEIYSNANLRRIEIDIRDHLGKKIPFEFETLTVMLHFKR